MTGTKTVYAMLEECSRSMSGTFTRQEILSWFRRHHPNVPESTVGAHIQAMTSNATNRERNSPVIGAREPLFDRVSHGLYRVHQADGSTANTTTAPRRVDAVAESTAPVSTERRPAHDDWHWEGHVQARVVAHLAAMGVAITRVADTASREHGTDIEGIHNGTRIHVEVKGWPSDRYVDPNRTHEPKKTPAAVQGRVWFADGLMHVLGLRTSYPNDTVALALPAVATYRRMFDAVRPPIERAHISVLWVIEDGTVSLDGWGRTTTS